MQQSSSVVCETARTEMRQRRRLMGEERWGEDERLEAGERMIQRQRQRERGRERLLLIII